MKKLIRERMVRCWCQCPGSWRHSQSDGRLWAAWPDGGGNPSGLEVLPTPIHSIVRYICVTILLSLVVMFSLGLCAKPWDSFAFSWYWNTYIVYSHERFSSWSMLNYSCTSVWNCPAFTECRHLGLTLCSVKGEMRHAWLLNQVCLLEFCSLTGKNWLAVTDFSTVTTINNCFFPSVVNNRLSLYDWKGHEFVACGYWTLVCACSASVGRNGPKVMLWFTRGVCDMWAASTARSQLQTKPWMCI